jgi:hypothetical protein
VALAADQDRDDVSLTFAQIEEILGFPLPPSSRNHEAHWYGYEGTAVGRAQGRGLARTQR